MKRMLLLVVAIALAVGSTFSKTENVTGGGNCNGSDWKSVTCKNLDGEAAWWSCGDYTQVFTQPNGHLDVEGIQKVNCDSNGCTNVPDLDYQTTWCITPIGAPGDVEME